MNNKIIRLMTIFAVTTFGTLTAAAQQKVDITGTGSSGIQPAKVTAGSKANAAVVVAVTDASGNPVQGQAANMQAITFVVPSGAPCGMQATGVTEVKPGIYEFVMAMPALAQCVWANGDYMGVARIFTTSYSGLTPFMVSVR